ncbi:MAG: ferrochelatase [Bacteroidota bacterium]
MKKGVLLVNLGTPDEPSRGAVYRYLKQFLLDPRVIDIPWLPRNLLVRGIIAPFRSGASSKIYKKLWTEDGSPIKIYGYALQKEVQKLLGEDYVVELAMRYQSPSIERAFKNLKDAFVDEIIVFPLFPHYASATTGSVHEEVMRLLQKEQVIPSIKMINSYHDNREMIEVFAENARKHDMDKMDHVLFSFHGVPQRHMKKADPTKEHCVVKEDCCSTLCDANKFCYSAQCHATAHLIAAELGLPKEKYTICYQSRLGRDPWMQPYTTDTLKERREAGDMNLLVFSAAFVADCLETTIEISDEYQEEWEEMGGEHLYLVESLNDHPKWIKAVANMIREA